MRLHVELFRTFPSYLGLVFSNSAGPQRAGYRLQPEKGGHYKELQGNHFPHNWGDLRAQGCATIYPRGAPSIFFTGAPGTRRQRQKS